ncbi:DUF4232 domain-containing protein [Mycobacterium sp. URHB0044]|jgi:hypothetical protein|uniref:DUF4232 domain-containing protein n=1 Tax=Mycobacterium sp. URHB0044 TaxID=1380386 RepID=UPI0007E8BA18|nr:DUF4232 domain-containing protein [Mycobacterium sp. URHB0044]
MNRIVRQLVPLALIVCATTALPALAHAERPQACSPGHVQVTNGGEQAAAGHRRVLLVFSLAPGATPCTLTGYPGVSSGAGGPLLHADWTLSGYMGGVQTEKPPVVTLAASQPAYAVVEGTAVDQGDADHPCPTYTDLQVIPPNTSDATTIPVTIDTCGLQVHPVTPQA